MVIGFRFSDADFFFNPAIVYLNFFFLFQAVNCFMNFLCLKNYLNTYCLLRKSSALELLHYSSAQLPMFELNCESKWKPSDRNEQEGAIREPIKIKLVIAILLCILLLVVLGYLQERRTYGCSGCTCTHSFPAPSRSCTYTCTHAI